MHEKLDWLRRGFLAIGDYWVPRGGGFPAGGMELEWFLVPGLVMLMPFYILTGNITLAHMFAQIGFYILSLIFSYWYGLIILKRKDASIVFAVAYSFNQFTLTWGKNINLAAALFLVPLFLIFLEKMFIQRTYSKAFLASLFLFWLFLDSWYITFFILIFTMIRLLFSFTVEKSSIINTIKFFGFFLVVSFLLCFPFVYPLIGYPYSKPQAHLNVNSIPPKAYLSRSITAMPFMRSIIGTPFMEFAYLGFSLILLAMVPLLGFRKNHWKTYFFYFAMFVFFFLYTIGSYSPLNIATLVYSYVPFGTGVPHVNIASLMTHLNLSICAGIGYICLADLILPHVKADTHKLKSKVKALIPFVVVALIFCDLTIGFEPTAMPMIFKDNNAYAFIKQQPGDFVILEIPSVRQQQAMTYIYTGHDTINTVIYGYGYQPYLGDFSEVWWMWWVLANTKGLMSSNGLAVYWKFDEGKGYTIHDESDMNNTGVMLNVAWTGGVSGSALSFNGVNSSVEIPHSKSLDLTTVGAMEFWVKLPKEEDAVEQGVIIGKGGGWNRPGWLITSIAKNHIRFQWQAGNDKFVDSATALSYSEWHHVAAVMDGHTMRIYIDGKRDPNFRVADEVNASTTDNVRIGLADNGLLPFKGEIDEVKIYNQLDISSISTLYGSKYVFLNADPKFHEIAVKYGLNIDPAWVNYSEIQDLQSYLNQANNFKLVYDDSRFYIYENLKYDGKVFAVTPQLNGSFFPFDFQLADANVTYSQQDLNTIEVHLENKEPVLLMVSQSFNEGWVATIESELSNGPMERKSVPISEVSGIQCLSINEAGSYKITLHYRYYESSLMLFLSFYVLATAMAYFVVCKGALSDVKKFGKFIVKPSIFYGLLLTVFSSLIYPRALSTIYAMQFSGYQFVDKYSSGIFLLGISLIVFAGLFYIIRPLTEFESQTHPNKLFMLTYIVLITSTILLALSTNILPPENSSYLAGRAFIGFILLLLTFLMEVTYKGYYDRIKNFAKSLGKQILGIRIRIRSRTLEIIRKSISRQEG